MQESNSYVYFALKGDDFNPHDLTIKIGVEPTEVCRKGDKRKYNPMMKYSFWELSSGKGSIDINKLIAEV